MKLIEGIIWNEQARIEKATPAEQITRLYDSVMEDPRNLLDWQTHWSRKNMRVAGAHDIYQVLGEIYEAQNSSSLQLKNAAEVARITLLTELKLDWQTTSTVAIYTPAGDKHPIIYNANCPEKSHISVAERKIGEYQGVPIETVLGDKQNEGLELMQAVFKTKDSLDLIEEKLYALKMERIIVTIPPKDSNTRVVAFGAEKNNEALWINFQYGFFKDGKSLGVPL